jgi:hypothetical protein
MAFRSEDLTLNCRKENLKFGPHLSPKHVVTNYSAIVQPIVKPQLLTQIKIIQTRIRYRTIIPAHQIIIIMEVLRMEILTPQTSILVTITLITLDSGYLMSLSKYKKI